MESVLAANLGVNDRRGSGAWLVRVVQQQQKSPGPFAGSRGFSNQYQTVSLITETAER